MAFEGTIGVAAYGVVANFAFVASALFVGFAQGIPAAGPANGVRAWQRPRRARGAAPALLTALVIATTTYAAVALAAEPLALAFNRDNDPQLTALAVDGMRVYFLGYFFAGANIVAAAFFSAVEKPAYGLAISIVRGLPAMLAFAAVLAALFGMAGVWQRSPRPRRPRSR